MLNAESQYLLCLICWRVVIIIQNIIEVANHIIGLPEIESFVEQSKLWELCPDSIFVFLLL